MVAGLDENCGSRGSSDMRSLRGWAPLIWQCLDWLNPRQHRALCSKLVVLMSVTQLAGDLCMSSLGQSLRLAPDPQDLLESHLIHRQRNAESEHAELSTFRLYLYSTFSSSFSLGNILCMHNSRTQNFRGALSKWPKWCHGRFYAEREYADSSVWETFWQSRHFSLLIWDLIMCDVPAAGIKV